MAENEDVLELPECEDDFEIEMEPQREHEVLSDERLLKWREHIQLPENLLGWRSRYKKPDRDPITKIQCDPVQAHQDILELDLPTPYEDKDAFKPFEQNLKKQQCMSTAGCIYTAAILLDKNAEDRQKELCEIMKEFIQQVREELHFVKADIAEARQEIANITAALCEEEEEGEEDGQQAAGIEQNGADTARLIPTLPDAPAAMSMEYLQFKKQAETQLAAMEPTKRMQTDQNCATAIAQATDDATRQKLEEDYKSYFAQEYNYYKAYYDQELAKLSGAPATVIHAAVPVTIAPQETITPVAPVEQAAPPPAVPVTQEEQEVTPVTPIKVKPAEIVSENENQPGDKEERPDEPAE